MRAPSIFPALTKSAAMRSSVAGVAADLMELQHRAAAMHAMRERFDLSHDTHVTARCSVHHAS